MKNIPLTIALLVIANHVYGQVLIALVFGDKLQTDKLTFGLVVAPTFSTLTGIDAKGRPGLALGLYFDIKISDNFIIHPEAIPKASFGATGIEPYSTGDDDLDALFENGSIKRQIRAMSLPIMFRYRIVKLLYVEAGPQVDWLLKVNDVYGTTVDDNDVTYTVSAKDQFSRFDFGFAVGLDMKLKKDKGMGLGFRYFRGLTDVMKTGGQQTNEAFYFNISIPVGTGKKSG